MHVHTHTHAHSLPFNYLPVFLGSAGHPQRSVLDQHGPGAVEGPESHPSVQFSTVPIPGWYCTEASRDREKL